jgi:hypothetical protein
MNKNFLICLSLSLLGLTLSSCGTEKNEKTNETSMENMEGMTEEKPSLRFEEYQVPSYPDAIIEMYSPLGNEKFEEGKVPFEFNIKNYPFGEGPKSFQLRMVVNGDEPISYNMPIFQREFKTGTYRVVAYLIDQEGIALKEFGNYVDRDFMVGNSNPFPDSQEPYMVVNLPGNGQIYAEGEEVIVDFLLIGGALKEDGIKFKLSVDGQEHAVKDLSPIKLRNLSPGNHEILVKLVKENDEELSGIFTSARRNITLK